MKNWLRWEDRADLEFNGFSIANDVFWDMWVDLKWFFGYVWAILTSLKYSQISLRFRVRFVLRSHFCPSFCLILSFRFIFCHFPFACYYLFASGFVLSTTIASQVQINTSLKTFSTVFIEFALIFIAKNYFHHLFSTRFIFCSDGEKFFVFKMQLAEFFFLKKPRFKKNFKRNPNG